MQRIRSAFFIALLISFASASAGQAQSIPASSPGQLERFTGIYAITPGKFIYIQPWPGGDGTLLYTSEAGQLRVLTFAAPNVFTAGPGLLLHSPVELKISFAENSHGQVTRLIRRGNGVRDTAATKLDSYRRENVSFRGVAGAITGVLLSPPGAGPHPAIVLIHGTGRTDRYNVLPIAHFLVSHGVALLGYDKRGVGGSAGDWRTASLDDLADDAVSAVEYLQGRKEIDPKRIGVFGASQGGWVAPLAASKSAGKSNGIAFVMSVSGPAMSPAEVELARLEYALRSRGASEDDTRDALELVKRANDLARGRESWASFNVFLERAKNAPWFRFVSVPLAADSWLLEHWRRMPLDYDPAPVIARLHVPVLTMFGAVDETVLPEKNAARWRAALDAGGNKSFAIQIFPNANHMLLEAQTGSEEEFPALQRFVPAFQTTVLDWLRTRGFIQR